MKLTKIITSLSLNPGVVARLDRLAAHFGTSRSAVAERVLDHWLSLPIDELPPRETILATGSAARAGRGRGTAGGVSAMSPPAASP